MCDLAQPSSDVFMMGYRLFVGGDKSGSVGVINNFFAGLPTNYVSSFMFSGGSFPSLSFKAYI